MNTHAPTSRAASLLPVTLGDLRFLPLISPDEIAQEVRHLAATLTEIHRTQPPLVVCVLGGAAPFHTDLIRAMPIDLEVDYLRIASYHGGLVSTGELIITAPPSTQAGGRNVIIVDDIVDTGRTIRSLYELYRQQGAAHIETAALLFKPEAAESTGYRPDHVCFEIPDRFVVGYGLDYNGLGRNLPAIYVLDTPSEGDKR